MVLHNDGDFPPPNNSSAEDGLNTVDEIIGNSPGWILHSGMTVLMIVVATAIALSLIIRYPDKISSSGIITTYDPFKTLNSRAFGVVDTVFTDHKSFVSEGSPILYIQNPADRSDVQKVFSLIVNIEDEDRNAVAVLSESGDWALGPMQSIVASLTQLYFEYEHYLKRTDFDAKIDMFQREIDEIHNWNGVLEQERILSNEEIGLSEKDMERNKILYHQGIISERALEQSMAHHLGVRKNFLLNANRISQNRVRIAALEQQKVDIHATRVEKIHLYRSRIAELIHNFRNAYHNWYQQYYITAPSDGTIQLGADVVEGQSIGQGQPVGYLIPELRDSAQSPGMANPKYARVWVSSAGFGKIRRGNRAILHVDAFPSKEYGTLETFVDDIFPVAEIRQEQRFHEIHLPLESPLVTDYQHPIHYSPDMSIQAIIITRDRSLFTRVFDQFLHLTNLHLS